jgi:phosphatidate cytidylyltransferase
MKRILTALVLLPLVLYVVLLGPLWSFYAVLSAVALICYYEYAGIAAAYGFGKLGPIGYAAGLWLLLVGEEGLLVLTLFALAAMAVSMRAADLAKGLPRASAMLLGVVYIFGCWRFADLLRRDNPYWLMFALALSWIGDIAAYYVGRNLGKHKLAPRVSPKKSWEGSAASVVASVLFGWLFLRATLPLVPLWHVIALAALGNVAGQIGDLAESAVKRGAGVKDSGTILPGHGGFLDRVDSTLFALPVVYLYLRAFRLP